MSTIQIACDNCGAKYKLPETFTSPRAKCQKCGSMIDVATQRDQAESGQATTGAKASAARPAVDRSKSRPAARQSSRATSKASPGGRPSSRRRKRDDGDTEGEAEGRGDRAPKKKDNTPMIFGGIGLVAIVIVVVVFMMGGDKDTPETDTDAQKPPTNEAAKETTKPDDKPSTDTSTSDEGTKPNDPAETAGDEQPGDGGKSVEGSTPVKSAEASAPASKLPKNAPMWMRMKAKTVADVPDAKSFGDVQWDLIDAAQKEQTLTWAANFADMGIAGRRAEAEMRKKENRYVAVFGLIDYLRTLDYNEPTDTMAAYAANRFLTDITDGLQTGLVAAELDESIDPRKAEWNSKTVKTWLKFFKSYPDEASFQKSCKTRRTAANKK